MFECNYPCYPIRSQLRPVLEMLKHKKILLNQPDWILLVEKTRQSILKSPEQYLFEYKKNNSTNETIQCVFEEFEVEMGISKN